MFKTASLFLGFIAMASTSARDLQGLDNWAFELTTVVANFGANTLACDRCAPSVQFQIRSVCTMLRAPRIECCARGGRKWAIDAVKV